MWEAGRFGKHVGACRPSETLVSRPANECTEKHFKAGLERRGVDWLATIEVDSLDLIETCSPTGFGVVPPVAAPAPGISARVRVLKLDDFVPVCTSSGRCFARGKLRGLLGAFFGGTPASSTTVAGPSEGRRRDEQLIE